MHILPNDLGLQIKTVKSPEMRAKLLRSFHRNGDIHFYDNIIVIML